MNKELTYENDKETATEKALNILKCFIPYNVELGNADITSLTGYHRATTSRIIKTLEKHNFLYQNQITKKYRLGSIIPELNAAISNSLSNNLISIAGSYLTELRNETGETTVLDLISGTSIIPSLIYRGKGPIVIDISIGTPVPWNTSPGLKGMLAFASDELRQRFFSQPMASLGKYTTTDLESYKQELETIRRTGYTFSCDEPIEGTANICFPIFDSSNNPIASISIAGLKSRITESKDNLARMIRKTAMAITDSINSR